MRTLKAGCRHIVADKNVSPLACARNICYGHKFCFRDTKNVSILFRNILCPQQMFPSPRNTMGNHVSPTMCPRLPGPIGVIKSHAHQTGSWYLRCSFQNSQWAPLPFFNREVPRPPPTILPPIVGYGNQDSTVFTLSASSKRIHLN